jgi:ankyrin repeat protein
MWLLGALKYRYFFINGKIISPSLLTTFAEKPQDANVYFHGYSVQDNFIGFFASIAQVYLIDSPYTGAVILVGICICSRILAFFALLGVVTGQLSAAYLLGLPTTAIHAGLWGYNSVLTCQALGGMFFILYGYRIWLFTVVGSIMTVLIQGAVSAFLSPVGMPALTFPFTLLCWIFCLIAGSKDLIAVKLTALSIPEDHYHRFRISRFVKTQFKYFNYLTNLSSSPNEDITLEDLKQIHEIIPILMCSYAYRNNLVDFKMLVKQKVNIHSLDHDLRSPLHISACQGNMKICKWLVDNCHMNVNLVDKFGGTPLYEAFWNGHFELLSFLYTHGARMPACKAKELAFYLNAFVYEGNLKAIKCLIKCGFNPDIGDYEGRNALHLAVITNHFDIVRYLVEETCASLNATDQFKQTAIQYASSLSDPVILNYLQYKRDHQISPTIPLGSPTSLGITVGSSSVDEGNTNNNEILWMSVEDSSLSPLLYHSVADGDMKKLSKFLEEFPNLNALECVDYDFRALAHFAAAAGQLEIIRFLSEHYDIVRFKRLMDHEDRWGLSPMDEAFRHQHFHICTFVKEHLLVQNVETHQDMSHSPKSESEDKDMVHLLRKWKKIFLFCTLATSGAAERIDALFSRGYFIQTELYADYDGRTPMHLAAAYRHLNVVQLLIRHGYDGTTHIDRWGKSPLDEAQRMKFKQIIDQLEQSKVSSVC